jgi:hypothetical protein
MYKETFIPLSCHHETWFENRNGFCLAMSEAVITTYTLMNVVSPKRVNITFRGQSGKILRGGFYLLEEDMVAIAKVILEEQGYVIHESTG